MIIIAENINVIFIVIYMFSKFYLYMRNGRKKNQKIAGQKEYVFQFFEKISILGRCPGRGTKKIAL